MLQEKYRELSNIANNPTFKELKQAFENYDFFADPMIDSVYPHINEDSFIIQIIGSPSAKYYWESEYYQDLRYRPETLNLITLAQKLAGQIKRELPGTVFYKGHFVCLHPHGRQTPHIDGPYWQRHAHRIGVPIITNPDAVTLMEDEAVHMPSGQLYELNVLRKHGSLNSGKEIRVHLFLDFIPLDRWKLIENHYKDKDKNTRHPTFTHNYNCPQSELINGSVT